MAYSLQAGFLLHQHNYQESSLITDIFTHKEGRLSLLARGIKRQKSSYLGLLRPFIPLNINYVGSGALKVLTHVEPGEAEYILPGINTYCGFYLNELLRNFLPVGESFPEVFLIYLSCLQQLKTQNNIQAALRIFEIQLMQALGYGLALEFEVTTLKPIEPDLTYRYAVEQGPLFDRKGPIHGDTFIAMQQANYTNQRQLNEAKWLMRQVIDFHLQGKKLHSRTLISRMTLKQTCKN